MKHHPLQHLFILVGYLTLVLFNSCGTSVSGVETTNGLSVTATTNAVSGKAPKKAQVYLCDTGYIPYINSGTGIQTASDMTGTFSFSIQPGLYTVVAISESGNAAAVTIATQSTAGQSPVSTQRTMENPGTITGAIAGAADTLLVYLAGTSYYQLLTEHRDFTITRIPPGDYLLRIIRLPAVSLSGDIILYEEHIVVSANRTVATGIIAIE